MTLFARFSHLSLPLLDVGVKSFDSHSNVLLIVLDALIYSLRVIFEGRNSLMEFFFVSADGGDEGANFGNSMRRKTLQVIFEFGDYVASTVLDLGASRDDVGGTMTRKEVVVVKLNGIHFFFLLS